MLTLTRMWHDRAISSWGMWILFSNWKKGEGMILRLKLFIWNLLCFRWRSTRFSSQKSPVFTYFSPYRTTISLITAVFCILSLETNDKKPFCTARGPKNVYISSLKALNFTWNYINSGRLCKSVHQCFFGAFQVRTET